MFNFAKAHTRQLSTAAVVAFQAAAAPLAVVAAHCVPYVDAVVYLVSSTVKHAAAVQDNDDLLCQAGRLSGAVTKLTQKLARAELKGYKPSFGHVRVVLVPIESLSRGRSVNFPTCICLSISLNRGSSTVLAFDKEFAACTALVHKACETLVLAVVVESYAGTPGLHNELAEGNVTRRAEYATTSKTLTMHEQPLEELQDSNDSLRKDQFERHYENAIKEVKSAAVKSSAATVNNVTNKIMEPSKKQSLKDTLGSFLAYLCENFKQMALSLNYVESWKFESWNSCKTAFGSRFCFLLLYI
jgi:hypothetical protein